MGKKGKRGKKGYKISFNQQTRVKMFDIEYLISTTPIFQIQTFFKNFILLFEFSVSTIVIFDIE